MEYIHCRQASDIVDAIRDMVVRGAPAIGVTAAYGVALAAQGLIHYRLKTRYRDGTTHVVFEPLDKSAESDCEPPQADPKGGGQDARNTLSLGWWHSCLTRASTWRYDG